MIIRSNDMNSAPSGVSEYLTSKYIRKLVPSTYKFRLSFIPLNNTKSHTTSILNKFITHTNAYHTKINQSYTPSHHGLQTSNRRRAKRSFRRSIRRTGHRVTTQYVIPLLNSLMTIVNSETNPPSREIQYKHKLLLTPRLSFR